MNQKIKRKVLEITVPKGYDLTELLDIDDSGYDFEDAVLREEVRVDYERDERSECV